MVSKNFVGDWFGCRATIGTIIFDTKISVNSAWTLGKVYVIKRVVPGLCEAVSRIPPRACCFLTMAERAGVDRMPSKNTLAKLISSWLTLSNDDFANAVSSCDLNDFFNGFGQKVSPVTTNNNGRASNFTAYCWEDTLKFRVRHFSFEVIFRKTK